MTEHHNHREHEGAQYDHGTKELAYLSHRYASDEHHHQYDGAEECGSGQILNHNERYYTTADPQDIPEGSGISSLFSLQRTENLCR